MNQERMNEKLRKHGEQRIGGMRALDWYERINKIINTYFIKVGRISVHEVGLKKYLRLFKVTSIVFCFWDLYLIYLTCFTFTNFFHHPNLFLITTTSTTLQLQSSPSFTFFFLPKLPPLLLNQSPLNLNCHFIPSLYNHNNTFFPFFDRS